MITIDDWYSVSNRLLSIILDSSLIYSYWWNPAFIYCFTYTFLYWLYVRSLALGVCFGLITAIWRSWLPPLFPLFIFVTYNCLCPLALNYRLKTFDDCGIPIPHFQWINCLLFHNDCIFVLTHSCNMLIRWRISLLTIEKTIPMYLFTTTGLLIDFWSSLLSRFNSFRHDVLC